MDILQERNLEDPRTDFPKDVPKDELMGRTSSMTGKGAFEGTQGKKEGVSPL